MQQNFCLKKIKKIKNNPSEERDTDQGSKQRSDEGHQ
jgi:hypothetical protein